MLVLEVAVIAALLVSINVRWLTTGRSMLVAHLKHWLLVTHLVVLLHPIVVP